MGLDTWSTSALRRNLSEMRGYLHEAFVDRASNSLVLRDKGETQYPILAKVVSILREELNDRLREAEDREYLGRTLREIERREAEDAAMFERDHPGVLEDSERDEPPCVVATLNAVGESAQAPILRAMKNAAWHSLQRLGTDVLVEYLKLWIKKHHDYGPENHAIWGEQGCVIRATDKLMRLKGRYFDGRMMQTDKTEDDWLDLIGYGLIGLIIERGQWPVTALEEVLADMKAKYGDDAFERAIADMKAEAEPPPVVYGSGTYRTAEGTLTTDPLTAMSGLLCPVCGSLDVHLYQEAAPESHYEWCHCGIECLACRTKIGGHIHIGDGQTLEAAVRHAIEDWKAMRR